MSTARWEALVGREFRRYRVDALIGVGGMSAVFAATHQNRRRFALKFLAPELVARSDLRARFVREGLVANTIGHPGAVTIVDDEITDEGVPFLVMELLDGSTLDGLQARHGNLAARDVVAVALEVLDVLVAAHAKGVIHRDLKPQNLFLTRKGRVKLLDFGIARLHDAENVALTRVGESFGTPGFKPREQELGLVAEIDGRTDIWALGATMFHLLTGDYPHEAETIEERSIFAATRAPRSLRDVAPGAPDGLVAVVDRALAFQREDRFPSAAAMRAALSELASTGELGGAADLGALARREAPARWLDPAFEPTALAPAKAESEIEQKLLDEGAGVERRKRVHARASFWIVGGGIVVAAGVGGGGAWQAHVEARDRARAFDRIVQCLLGSTTEHPSSTIELELASDAARAGSGWPERCEAHVTAFGALVERGGEVALATSDLALALEQPGLPPYRTLPLATAAFVDAAARAGYRPSGEHGGVEPPPAPYRTWAPSSFTALRPSGHSWRELSGAGTWLTDDERACRLEGTALRCREAEVPRGTEASARADGTIDAIDDDGENVELATWRNGVASRTPVGALDAAMRPWVLGEGWVFFATDEGEVRGIDFRSGSAAKPIVIAAGKGVGLDSCEDRLVVLACPGYGRCADDGDVRRLRFDGAWREAERCPPPLDVAVDDSAGFWRLRAPRGVALFGPEASAFSAWVVASRAGFAVVELDIHGNYYLARIDAEGTLTPIEISP